MKRATALLFLLTLGLPPAALAEEGMWRPNQLPSLESQLKKLGLKINASSLADLTGRPLNAVIWLGGCTASFVSPDGLVVTNHHCAYSSIQHNSSKDRNLIKTGFLARSRAEELRAAPGSRVLVTVAVDDVTSEVLASIPEGAGGLQRYQAIEDKEKALIAACEEAPGFRCNVRSYYGGLEFELIKQLEIRDVRLVYAPPDSIGKYGGDIDNWMWPRHTGDFAFYRAYVAPDGKPADYDERNVPYRPRHVLKVSTKGVKPGDFVMAAGYPGRTNRYRLASEVREIIDWYYPKSRQAYVEWLAIIEKATANHAEAKVKYASLVASLNNVVKNRDGMLNGFSKSDIVDRKTRLEDDLQNWINQDPGRQSAYQSAIDDLRKLVDEMRSARERDLYYESMGLRSSLLGAARRLYRLSREKQKRDARREPGYQQRDWVRIKESLERIDRTYDPAVDRAVWRHFILAYAAIPESQHVKAFDEWFAIAGPEVNESRIDQRLDAMYRETRLGDAEKRLAWMDAEPAALESCDDPFIQLAVRLYESDLELERQRKDIQGRFQLARSRFMRVLLAYYDSLGKPIYPDANSTLRVTYGAVKGYVPRDGVLYMPFTTLRGILEKDTGVNPFDAPKRQLELIRQGAYGSHRVDSLDSVPVNFLATLDSTGGNSGSPTMNARGELVGLLFDGNWESIIADWDFIPAITRSIHVDIRYMLWIMENLDGARHLLEEMGVADP